MSAEEVRDQTKAIKKIVGFACGLHGITKYPEISVLNFYETLPQEILKSKEHVYVGLTLPDVNNIFLNSLIYAVKQNKRTSFDAIFPEIVLVHELAHIFVQDSVEHSLSWAKNVIQTWRKIKLNDNKNKLPSWNSLRLLILKDFKNNVSPGLYSTQKNKTSINISM